MSTLRGTARAWAGVSAILMSLLGSRAHAESAPVRVAYAAAEGCPSGAEFAAAIATRGRQVTVVEGSAPATMRIGILADRNGGYHGSLAMEGSTVGGREVSAPTCRQVADALAVVTVSSLGPDGAGASRIAEAPGANPETASPDAEAARLAATTPERSAVSAPTAVPVSPLQAGNIGAAPGRLAVGSGTVRFDSDTAMTLFGGGMTGLVPGRVLPRLDFEVARTNLVTSPEGATFRVVPTVRLHASFFPYGEPYHSNYGTTTAIGYEIGADICAPLHYDRGGFSLLLCAEFMGGYFGLQTTDPSGKNGPIRLEGTMVGGLGIDLNYNLGRHFHVGLKTGAGLVFGGLTADASDGSPIFKSSLVAFHGMLGVGGQF